MTPSQAVAELTTVGTDEAVIHDGAAVHRHTGLAPGTEQEVDGFRFHTLPEPGAHLATFATVNDVHFGETVCGEVGGHPEVGPVFRVDDGEPPYPEVMNRAAVAEIDALDPALVVVKGDLTSEGTMPEYDAFLDVYARAFGDRLVHVRGNHESWHRLAVADQPVQVADLPGARMVLLDTSVDGAENGAVRPAQLEELDEIAATSDRPVLLFGHHHVWDPGARPSDPSATSASCRTTPSGSSTWSPGGPRSSGTSQATPTGTGCGASRPRARCRGWRSPA